jgi:hypothetical protein
MPGEWRLHGRCAAVAPSAARPASIVAPRLANVQVAAPCGFQEQVGWRECAYRRPDACLDGRAGPHHLADKAGVGIVTVRLFEGRRNAPRRSTRDVIGRALEAAGVDFIDQNGGGPSVRFGDPIHNEQAGAPQRRGPGALHRSLD